MFLYYKFAYNYTANYQFYFLEYLSIILLLLMRMFSITNNLLILKVRVILKMYKGTSKLLGNITCIHVNTRIKHWFCLIISTVVVCHRCQHIPSPDRYFGKSWLQDKKRSSMGDHKCHIRRIARTDQVQNTTVGTC